MLERQIDYGAKLGHVVLSLARMELNNFYKNVTPVSDFYDQRGMLISVSDDMTRFYRFRSVFKAFLVLDQRRAEPDRGVQRLPFLGLAATERPQEPGVRRHRAQRQRALEPS